MIVVPLVPAPPPLSRAVGFAPSSTEFQPAPRDFGCTEWHAVPRSWRSPRQIAATTKPFTTWRGGRTDRSAEGSGPDVSARSRSGAERPPARRADHAPASRRDGRAFRCQPPTTTSFARGSCPDGRTCRPASNGLTHPDSPPPPPPQQPIPAPIPAPIGRHTIPAPIPAPSPSASPTRHPRRHAGGLPVLDRGLYARRTRLRRGLAPIPFRRSARAQADRRGRRHEPFGGLRPRRLRGISRHRGDRDRRQAWRSLGGQRGARRRRRHAAQAAAGFRPSFEILSDCCRSEPVTPVDLAVTPDGAVLAPRLRGPLNCWRCVPAGRLSNAS